MFGCRTLSGLAEAEALPEAKTSFLIIVFIPKCKRHSILLIQNPSSFPVTVGYQFRFLRQGKHNIQQTHEGE